MRFNLSNKRAMIGHRISVKVTAKAGELIGKVSTELDGRKLGADTLRPAERQYERVFEHAGGGGPGQDHVLRVRATNTDGETAVASRRWNDVS
jgi:hypothetical protein